MADPADQLGERRSLTGHQQSDAIDSSADPGHEQDRQDLQREDRWDLPTGHRTQHVARDEEHRREEREPGEHRARRAAGSFEHNGDD